MLKEGRDADDATQDVFVRLLARRDDLDDAHLGTLLWTIATQVSLNHLRRRRRKPTDGSALLDAIAGADDVEERTIVARTLDAIFAREESARLRVSTRTLAVLRYVDGMTHDEVGAATGLSAAAVRKRLDAFRARVPTLEETP
jgi:RNA polymerase sigma-70 factor (ECF subfamily)